MPEDTDESDDLDEDFDLDDDTPMFERFHDTRQATRATKKSAAQVKTLAEASENATFQTTYTPSRHEAVWLRTSLRPFFDEQNLIDDVLFSIKGGKEATVYCAHVHPDAQEALGTDRVAAKVYRPREFRNLRNDALYRTGRAVLTDEGRAAKKSDTRLMKAVNKKTGFGAVVQHTSWLLYEYTTLQKLHSAGCAVPRPFAVGENAILMGYVGGPQMAAPTLIEVGLSKAEAERCFKTLVESLRIMVGLGMVHGDLSAYNVLYWEGQPTIIDFPQVIRFDENDQAEPILLRDLTRLCDYFSRYGIVASPERLRASFTETP